MGRGRKLAQGVLRRQKYFQPSSSYQESQGLKNHMPGSQNGRRAYGAGKDHKKPRR